MECGKHDILPEAGADPDLARVPVTMPRDSNADMRRDGSMTAQPVQTKPSMSADECTAHQTLKPNAEPQMDRRKIAPCRVPASNRVIWSRGDGNGRQGEEKPDYEGRIKAARCGRSAGQGIGTFPRVSSKVRCRAARCDMAPIREFRHFFAPCTRS
jgi:hypothetical protein